jgi:hypothetical protein
MGAEEGDNRRPCNQTCWLRINGKGEGSTSCIVPVILILITVTLVQ